MLNRRSIGLFMFGDYERLFVLLCTAIIAGKINDWIDWCFGLMLLLVE